MHQSAQRRLREAIFHGEGLEPALPVDIFAARLGLAAADTAELNDLGASLFLAGAYVLAHECYRRASEDEQALGSQANLGRCEIRLGRAGDAELRARMLVATHSDRVPGWQLLGEALAVQGRYVEAIEALQHAVSVAPGQAVLRRQLGEMCEQANELEMAHSAYALALALNAEDTLCLRLLIRLKRRLCRWDELDQLSARLHAYIGDGRSDISPFDFLVEGSTAALQLACARRRAGKISVSPGLFRLSPALRASPVSGKMRVGFVSHGFGMHPTTLLTTKLFEELHSSEVEVHLFSTNDDVDSVPKQRAAAAASRFHDCAGTAPVELAERIVEAGIEILFDLDGYNRSRVPEVFAYRPSAVQVSWLAFPGTTGASFIDYVIADRFVLPESMQPFFSEHVAYLSRCFQSSDTTRVIAPAPSREACGLPATGVVYVCFNGVFKIGPRSFARMMRILFAVEGSVLWLLNESEQACANLRAEARAAGIDPERLVFMERLSHASYLARYRHADLFLDTEYYNAHTTASDALWAGCPVLTRPGDTFAARVAGSLNHHLGMDEMNVVDDDGFVDSAVRYGNDVAFRAATRDKLVRRKRTSGVFDMTGFARDFTALLIRMAQHHRAGGKAVNFPRN